MAGKWGRKQVAASVVYRLLARHGWRKLAPDTRHPKSDPAIRRAWMFQPWRCWPPAPLRPVMSNGYEREFA